MCGVFWTPGQKSGYAPDHSHLLTVPTPKTDTAERRRRARRRRSCRSGRTDGAVKVHVQPRLVRRLTSPNSRLVVLHHPQFLITSYHIIYHICFCSKVNDNTLTIWQTPTRSNRARRIRLRWSTYCRLQIKMKNKLKPSK